MDMVTATVTVTAMATVMATKVVGIITTQVGKALNQPNRLHV